MTNKLRMRACIAALSMLLAFCTPFIGQVLKGSISGTITDPNGAVVPGAQVKATHVESGQVFTTTSDNSGSFRFSLIPPGNYKVEFTKQGFKTSQQSNILVSAGSDRGIGTIALSLGEANISV